MNYLIDLQIACHDILPVGRDCLVSWIEMTLDEQHKESAELTLRLVDIREITDLNKTYRKQDKPTNVLAFPSNIPKTIPLDCPFLGDVVICPAVLQTESIKQNISLEAHWAHIIIHGILHLLGYDHIEEEDANIMQNIEGNLLNKLGFINPYHTREANNID